MAREYFSGFMVCLLAGLSSLLLGCGVFGEAGRAHVFPSSLLNADFSSSAISVSSYAPWGLPERSLPSAEVAAEPTPAKEPEVRRSETSKPEPIVGELHAEDFDESAGVAYVVTVYDVNGVDLRENGGTTPSIVDLYQLAYRRGVLYHSNAPAVGDLVFFHNTFDRNHDGRSNDWYTSVGVVESAGSDGTVSALMFVGEGVRQVRLNLGKPDSAKGTANTVLRAADQPLASGEAGTGGQLFAGYANLLGEVEQVVVIDNWKPGMRASR